MSSPLPPRQRSIHILYLPIHSRRPRAIPWILHIPRNMKHRHPTPLHHHSHGIYRLRITMRTDILLRSNRHHQPPISHPLHRHGPCSMNLRGLLRRQSHSLPILRLPLPTPLHHLGPSNSTPSILARNRIQQPNRNPLRPRHNPLSPLLHN